MFVRSLKLSLLLTMFPHIFVLGIHVVYIIFIFGAWDRFTPAWRDFEPELNLDDQGSGRYRHIKKIRNEKLK